MDTEEPNVKVALQNNEEFLLQYPKLYSKNKPDWDNLFWISQMHMNSHHVTTEKMIDWSKVQSVLDLGCGAGNFFTMIQNKGLTLIGVDAILEFIQSANKKGIKNATFFHSTIENYLPTQSPDLITLIGVLVTINPDIRYKRILSKMFTICKPGGQILIADQTHIIETYGIQKIIDAFSFPYVRMEDGATTYIKIDLV